MFRNLIQIIAIGIQFLPVKMDINTQCYLCIRMVEPILNFLNIPSFIK